jgi:hypothetical protein
MDSSGILLLCNLNEGKDDSHTSATSFITRYHCYIGFVNKKAMGVTHATDLCRQIKTVERFVKRNKNSLQLKITQAASLSHCTVPVLKTPCHEDVWGSWGLAPHSLHLSTRWKWVVSFTPRWKSPRYVLDGRLGGPQSRSGRGGEEKNIPSWLLKGNKPWLYTT